MTEPVSFPSPVTRWGDKRYHSLAFAMRERFGEQVYKLSLNGGMSCPNRDGTLGYDGCAFCSEGGSGDFAASSSLSVSSQIAEAKKQIAGKAADCRRFIAYFQAYSNTYAPVPYLSSLFHEAICREDIAALSIATRPDCFSSEIYDLLDRLNREKPLWVDLGFQTMHPSSHRRMNTGFSIERFEECVRTLYELHIEVIAHVMFSLPGETPEDMLSSVKYLAHLPIDGVKLQMLHVLKNTALGKDYEKAPFPLLSMDEYTSLIVSALEYLPPQVVIHRLTGDGPRQLLLAPQWTLHKKQVLNMISHKQKQLNSYQGKEVTNGRTKYDI